MDEWSIGLNADGELFIMKNGDPLVVFTADYAQELYMALHCYYNQTIN